MKQVRQWGLGVAFALLSAVVSAQPDVNKVQWLGQSAFRITTASGKVIVTDPWLKANPLTPPQYKDLAALGKIDVLLVSHGHTDHVAERQSWPSSTMCRFTFQAT